MVIENIHFLHQEDDMDESTSPEPVTHDAPTTEPQETPEVTEGHPDNDESETEVASDAEVDSVTEGASTEPLEGSDGAE